MSIDPSPLIERYVQNLRDLDVPVMRCLNSALTRDEVEHIIRSRHPHPPEEIPDEYYEWFSWHNGFDVAYISQQQRVAADLDPAGNELSSLEWMMMFLEMRDVSAPDYWDRPLLPLFRDTGGYSTALLADGDEWHMYYVGKDSDVWLPLDHHYRSQPSLEDPTPTLRRWITSLCDGMERGKLVLNEFATWDVLDWE